MRPITCFLAIALSCGLFAQTKWTIKLNATTELGLELAGSTQDKPTVVEGSEKIVVKSFSLVAPEEAADATLLLDLDPADEAEWPNLAKFSADGLTQTVDKVTINGKDRKELNDLVFMVTIGAKKYFFKLNKVTSDTDDGSKDDDSNKPPPIDGREAVTEVIAANFQLESTSYGLTVKSGGTIYTGRKYVHLFFDEFGNPIGTVPFQGISNYQYVVHIFYLRDRAQRNATRFSAVQTKGGFSSTLNLQNVQLPRPDLEFNKSGSNEEAPDLEWGHSELLLGTSTEDIEFKLVRTMASETATGKPTFEKTTLETFVIKMAPVFHGSIDVGFIDSKLANPTFTLVTSPTVDSLSVVKRSGDGNRGMVTFMATLYSSPVVFFKSLRHPKDVPMARVSGRNYLDDHSLFERFYPCVGVGISDKALENLFVGVNWEIARGAAVWAGYHYGKVNTYSPPGDFEFGSTPQTQEQFELYRDYEWKWSCKPSFGVTVDLRIVTALLGGGAAAP